MKHESLILISPKRFRQLMGGTKANAIIRKGKFGKPIHIRKLSDHALNRYLMDIIKKNKSQTLGFINSVKYKKMRPFQKKHVSLWLPIMLDLIGLKGEKVKKYLSNKGVSYSTYFRYRKLWLLTGGDINVLKTNYHTKQDLLKITPFEQSRTT